MCGMGGFERKVQLLKHSNTKEHCQCHLEGWGRHTYCTEPELQWKTSLLCKKRESRPQEFVKNVALCAERASNNHFQNLA